METLDWLAVVRHGESIGNAAAAEAEAGGAEVIDIAERDADVPLSGTGREQATALRRVLAADPPGVAVVSPYLRARQTAQTALAGLDVPVRVDERLRDRELGVLDLLTSHGVAARLPGEAQRRTRLGKFYYRPPGGESWTDVLLRLRSLLRDVRADHPGGRVVLFAHEAIVLLVRYLVEGLDEAELMAIATGTTIANCSISSWRRVGGVLRPETFNDVTHLRRDDAPVTRQEEVHAYALSQEPGLLRPDRAVLTPNVTEAGHLLGRDPGDDLTAAARALAGQYGAVVSLYGHIADPDGRVWHEESGDAGLGTSGSGDARAGVVAGLLGRDADPAQAACWGAYAHAVSGQRLSQQYGRTGFLAREIVGEVAHTIAMV